MKIEWNNNRKWIYLINKKRLKNILIFEVKQWISDEEEINSGINKNDANGKMDADDRIKYLVVRLSE